MCQSLRVGCMDIFVLLVDEGAVPAVCVEREGMSVNVSVECERGRYGDTETERGTDTQRHKHNRYCSSHTYFST